MPSGDGSENVQKNLVGLISKKKTNNFARAVHLFGTFPCRCFGGRQRETSRNFLVTRCDLLVTRNFPWVTRCDQLKFE